MRQSLLVVFASSILACSGPQAAAPGSAEDPSNAEAAPSTSGGLSSSRPSSSSQSPPAAQPSAAAAASAEPLYVLGSGVPGADDDTSYVTPLSSLAAGVQVDYSRSLEQPGVGRLYGEEGVGFFALGIEESERITRYDVNERGAFTRGPSLSLLGAGVTEMAEPYAVVFVSATKAYYLDVAQLQVLIWNPAEMTLTGRIDLGELARDGSIPSFSVRPVERGGQLVFAAGWQDQDASGVQPGMALISIDTQSDALLIQPADERCRDPGEVSLATDGTIYVFSNFTNALGKLGTGHGGFGPGIIFDDFFGTTAWRWARVDFPSLSRLSIDADRPPTTYNSSYFRVGGALYISESSADFARTTLLDVSGDQPLPALTFPGYLTNLVRVR